MILSITGPTVSIWYVRIILIPLVVHPMLLPYPLANYLQEKMPEIEATASTSIYRDMKFRLGDNEQEVVMATADSVFMNFFNIRLLKGTVNFLKENDPEIAITEEFARKLFGSEEDALGERSSTERTSP